MKKLLSLISAFFICGSFAFADITTAKKHEASSAYVNAIIEYCKASASDPWNKDIISGIERCAKKLASGSWGNNYGCSADANVIKSWKEMEAVYQDFLCGTIRYTLTYTEKVKMEKANDYDQAFESVRFKPKFSFKKNFPAESDIKSAFSKLMKSDYDLASQVKKYGKNVSLNSPSWKQPPREVKGSDLDYFGPKYSVEEAVYQDFLCGTIRYTLTYTEKVKMEKANDYDQAFESVRFKPKFSFKKNFPAESDIKSAFSKLMKSDYDLASQVKKYGKNVSLNSPSWKQPPREVKGSDLDYFGPKYSVEDAIDKSMPEVDVKNPDTSNAGFMKSLKLVASEMKGERIGVTETLEYHMSPATVNYSKVSPYSWSGKYWIGWKPTVRVAVADKNGNRISNWSWWYPEDGFEIRVPLSKADKADHYIISDTWCMRGRGDGSVCMTYLDFNYKPQSKQIIKK